MQQLTNEINEYCKTSAGGTRHPMTVEEVALGFVDVANESMCRPIRALTQVSFWIFVVLGSKLIGHYIIGLLTLNCYLGKRF